MRSFLGLCSYYRKFIYKFSDIARPLHALTEANKKFLWNSDCTLAFGKLKEALTSAPILSYPNDNDFFSLDTDASNTGMGAVLSQEQENTEKVLVIIAKLLVLQNADIALLDENSWPLLIQSSITIIICTENHFESEPITGH